MQNDPQDENPIKKALRTWRALREIKKEQGNIHAHSQNSPSSQYSFNNLYSQPKLTNTAYDKPSSSGRSHCFNTECTPYAQRFPTKRTANSHHTPAHTNYFANRNCSARGGQKTGYPDLMGWRTS
jgi:hypothetical protein